MNDYPDHQSLIADLKDFQTRSELLTSAAYQKHQAYLTQLLTTPRLYLASQTTPRLTSFLRLAHWNIEKGKHLDALIEVLRTHSILREADLISINEADVGMNRSGQRNVARVLGQALHMHAVFAPCYLEFSKGYGDDLTMPGTNTSALQGNVILSRYPFKNPRVIELPVCYDHFSHAEKRIGNRNALVVEVEIHGKEFSFMTAHLEVRNAPSCRAKQMGAMIEALEKPGLPRAAVIAGDFNTNTFARGGRFTTLQGFARLLVSNPEQVRRQLASPQVREPLFSLLRKHGFTEDGLNGDHVTCYVPMKILEDRGRLPGFLAKAIGRQIARYEGQLDFRLDWMIGRAVDALRDRELIDPATGISSCDPQTIAGLRNEQGAQMTDHDPITVDLRF